MLDAITAKIIELWTTYNMSDPSDSIIQAESGGDPNATNPNSSAVGTGQFIAPTWLSVIKQHFPDLAQGKSDDELLAMRTDPALSKQMTDAYASDNQATLRQAGVPVTPGTTYLAHFAGPQGAVKILQSDPNAPVSSILGAAAVKANPFLQGMTAQGLQAWAARKMGTASPAQQASAAPAAAPQQPQPALPAQAAPIFANAAPTAPAAPAYQDPTAPAAPMFAPARKPIDLSGLRMALANSPIFANLKGMV